jgi:hypothetical protein
MTWILFVWIIGYHDNQSQITQEFVSKERCVSAADEWRKRVDNTRSYSDFQVRVLCVPK